MCFKINNAILFQKLMCCMCNGRPKRQSHFIFFIITAESQLLVHPEGVRLMDSRSSVGVYDKSAPHGRPFLNAVYNGLVELAELRVDITHIKVCDSGRGNAAHNVK